MWLEVWLESQVSKLDTHVRGQRGRLKKKKAEMRICALTWDADERHVIALTTGGQKGDLLLGPTLHLHGSKHLLIMGYEDLFVDGGLGTHDSGRRQCTAGNQFNRRQGPLVTEEKRMRKELKKEITGQILIVHILLFLNKINVYIHAIDRHIQYR